uniref:Uncharacterized protein n=1 Tax=Solanum lycopersicum TaxID=4081 RepID=A0A3Q7GNQ0_SOLLC
MVFGTQNSAARTLYFHSCW